MTRDVNPNVSRIFILRNGYTRFTADKTRNKAFRPILRQVFERKTTTIVITGTDGANEFREHFATQKVCLKNIAEKTRTIILVKTTLTRAAQVLKG